MNHPVPHTNQTFGYPLEPILAFAPPLSLVKRTLSRVRAERPEFNIRLLTKALELPNRFPEVFVALRRCFSDPFPAPGSEPPILQNPFVPGKPSRRNFTNIGQHCLASACLADLLCRELERVGLLTPRESHETVRAAALHDASKFLYVLRKEAARSARQRSLIAGRDHEAQDYQLLTSHFGLEKDIAEIICQTGRFTGGTNCYREFTFIDGHGQLDIRGDLKRRLIRLADDMIYTSMTEGSLPPTTILVTPAERVLFHAMRPDYAPILFGSGLGHKRGQSELVPLDFTRPLPSGTIKTGTYAQIHSFISSATLEALSPLIERGSDTIYLLENLSEQVRKLAA